MSTPPPPTNTSHTLSEAESKRFLAPYGLPIAPERVVASAAEAAAAATEMGFPVVAKLCGASIAHKTERGLVRLNLADAGAVETAAAELLAAATPADGEVGVLVAPMIGGSRELICGLSRDEQFGMTVMLGIGGVLAEAIADVSIRLVPITPDDAASMLDDLEHQSLLGPFRGEPAVDRSAVIATLLALNEAAMAHPDLVSVDLNPLIINSGSPVAVDALVELTDPAPAGS